MSTLSLLKYHYKILSLIFLVAFVPKQISCGDGIFSSCSSGGKGAASDFSIFGGQGLGVLKIYFFIWGNLILNPIFFLENPKIGHFIFILCCLFNHVSFCLVSPCPSIWSCKPAFYTFWFLKYKAFWVSNLLRSMNVSHVYNQWQKLWEKLLFL